MEIASRPLFLFLNFIEMAFSSEQLIAILIALNSLVVANFPKSILAKFVALGAWLGSLAILLNGSNGSPVGESVIALTLLVMAVDWLLRQGSPETMSTSLLLAAAACAIGVAATSLFLLWVAVAFLVLHTLSIRIQHGSKLVSRNDALPISALSLTTGLLIFGLTGPDNPAQQLASILVVCGMGGLLEWFPFPRVSTFHQNIVETIPGRLVPSIAAAVVFWKLISLTGMSEPSLAWFAIAALFTLLFSALKIMGETSLSRKASLIPITILSHSLIAALLMGWVQLHPRRTWTATSNFPSASSFFITILVCETIACIAFVAGCRLLAPQADYEVSDDLLSGLIKQKPWAGTIVLASLVSLAGLAPMAGFWWRFLVTSALLLPHRQSTLNGLTEAHAGLTTFAIALVLIWLLLAAGYISQIGRILLEIPFRIRDLNAPIPIQMAASILLICLLALSIMPFRFAQQMPISIW